jgi:hypothetical protein
MDTLASGSRKDRVKTVDERQFGGADPLATVNTTAGVFEEERPSRACYFLKSDFFSRTHAMSELLDV